MGWIKKMVEKADEVLERASTCDGCGHSNPAGVEGCGCPASDCTCG